MEHGEKRNFIKYLKHILKTIPTININNIDGYKYAITVNGKVLNEYCKYGSVGNKIIYLLQKCNKIETVSNWQNCDDFYYKKLFVKFCKYNTKV